jgi:site-specific DNA-methyltransferase (adenine-specific)
VTPYYEDGLVTLYHGDAADVLPTLAGVDLLCTDPPYGIGYKHGARKGGVRFGMDEQAIVGDEEPFDPAHLLAVGVRTILWGGNHYPDRLPSARGWLIWDKRDGTASNDQSDAEMAWTNFLSVSKSQSSRWSGAHRTGREQAEGRLHVNQKPVALMTWCIGLAGPATVICDPYAGSGSTLVAAKELGIQSIGIEIDEQHCATAARRLGQQTLGLSA